MARPRAICRAIRETCAWKVARLVCAFLPMKSEPDIRSLWLVEGGPAFCFPRLHRGEIELIRVDDRALLAHADWRLAAPEFDQGPRPGFSGVNLILVSRLCF